MEDVTWYRATRENAQDAWNSRCCARDVVIALTVLLVAVCWEMPLIGSMFQDELPLVLIIMVIFFIGAMDCFGAWYVYLGVAIILSFFDDRALPEDWIAVNFPYDGTRLVFRKHRHSQYIFGNIDRIVFPQGTRCSIDVLGIQIGNHPVLARVEIDGDCACIREVTPISDREAKRCSFRRFLKVQNIRQYRLGACIIVGQAMQGREQANSPSAAAH